MSEPTETLTVYDVLFRAEALLNRLEEAKRQAPEGPAADLRIPIPTGFTVHKGSEP